MATHTNRHLDHIKTNLKVNELKTRKLLAQSKKTRSTAALPKGCETRAARRLLAEKKVVNSFTNLINSRSESNFKNTLVFNVLVKRIKEHLIKTGKCRDDAVCDETAKKMAAFVSDVMNETYKAQKLTRRRSIPRVPSIESRKSALKMRGRESLSTIPEEPRMMTKVNKAAQTKSIRLPSKSNDSKIVVKAVSKEASRTKTPTKMRAKGDLPPVAKEKEKINSWLADVDSRTQKWTDWIKETVAKAESSKRRIRSGENVRDVSKDWKRFIKGKKSESDSFGDSSKGSTDWQTEAFRKRGEESIQQWLNKSKLANTHRRNPSEYSARTTSTESLYSVWSSRAPSSLIASESILSKLRQIGVSPIRTRH